MDYPTTLVGQQLLVQGDCVSYLRARDMFCVDVVITSPPYNLDKEYASYQDDLPREQYLQWIGEVCAAVRHVLRPEGSFFLNVGFTARDPWLGMDVANAARKFFTLQNSIAWVKSVTIGEETHGHFQPVNSQRFLNQAWEHLFHFTRKGDVPLDRLALGVPYMDKSNLFRGTRGKNGDLRCRGNTWYLPYETIQWKAEKGNHPAVFPVALAENCLKLHDLRYGRREQLVVVDPFVGTGSTLVACSRLGCAGIGIDIDESYLAYAKERLEAESHGQTHP
jgi:site-specific DNA-methyltransferase (adenine-specific)